MIENIQDLPFTRKIIEKIQEMGITSLYPPQKEALDKVLQGGNLVLSVPTASGKSLVAYLTILAGLSRGKKGLYIVPLRALAAEKFEEISVLLPKGYRAVMSIGDYEETDRKLMTYDVIVATSEKADSLFRHRPDFLKEFSVVVADEVHLITVPERGHILEVLLTRIRQANPEAQILALSATIPNSEEIAEWLDAAHIRSEWRPVDLKEGVYHDGIITFPSETREIGKGDPVKALVRDGLESGGQCLVFVNSRRSTEAEAKRLGTTVKTYADTEKLQEIAELLITTQNEPNRIVDRLAECVSKGTGFHHAGLGNTQRRIIEKSFKSGLLKALVATPTLAAGINLPARRVIIRDLFRYGGKQVGNRPIPNLELKQMAGRAGRPGYDPYGEALFVVKKEDDVTRVMDNLINGETERIESKLGVAPTLRIHIVSSIASGFVSTYTELLEFLNGTFCAHQYGINERAVREALEFLKEHGLVYPASGCENAASENDGDVRSEGEEAGQIPETGSGNRPGEESGKRQEKGPGMEGGIVPGEQTGAEPGFEPEIEPRNGQGIEPEKKSGIAPGKRQGKRKGSGRNDFITADKLIDPVDTRLSVTPFGKLTSDLYIDPKSAVIMKRALDNSLGKVHTPLSYFQTIAATPDMITLYIRESELGDYFEQALYLKDELFLFPGDPLIYGENDIIANEFFAEELKTAILLNKWIDEIPEDTLTTTFNIGPGDLRNKVETARWLLHAMERIAALYHFDHRILKNVIRRITYGVKEELLPLVVFKGIGRVRARLLHKHGYRDAGNLKKADIHDLLEIDGIGKSTVLRIMEELGRDVSEIMEADEEIQRLQKTLFEFGITRK